MNIRELNAALVVMGGIPTTLFGSTISANGHTLTISENGNINIDYNPIAKVKSLDTPQDKWNLVQSIKETLS